MLGATAAPAHVGIELRARMKPQIAHGELAPNQVASRTGLPLVNCEGFDVALSAR
jgi:hypothetical protein